MLRSVLVAAAVVALLAVVLVALLWVFQRQLIYLPDAGPVPPATRLHPQARDVVLETRDGLELGAWWLPAEAADAPAVLVANGNAGNRGDRAPLARALHERGLSVLLFDYRGYAGNAGDPTEEGLALDVRAARSYLVEQAGVPGARLLYLGESLGAAVVADLATEHPPAALVLRSPFVDLAAVASVHYPVLPVRALLRDDYPVREHVAEVRVPLVVVYGADDSVVPPEQSRAVAAAAPQLRRLVEVPDADHNEAELVHGEPVVDAVARLADQVSR